MWIEIFRAGEHTDSAGVKRKFEVEFLDKIARRYNEEIEKTESSEAPLVKGHPSSDAPAYGWVERLARRGDRLVAKLKDVSPAIAEEIRRGLYKKVSASFYPDFLLRHVGLLGAAQPAVKGLREASFRDGETGASFVFSLEPGGGREERDLKKENDKLKERIAKLEKELEAERRERSRSELRQYAESLAGESGARIYPKQIDDLTDILTSARALEGDFSREGSSLEKKIKNFVENLPPSLYFGEFAVASASVEKEAEFAEANVDPERLELHKRALKLIEENPGLSYESAALKLKNEV